jgi:hypothetical protein
VSWTTVTVVGALASAVTAQVTGADRSRIVTGSNIGFRMEGTDSSGKPVGTWVVRIAGEWVPVSTQVKAAPERIRKPLRRSRATWQGTQ